MRKIFTLLTAIIGFTAASWSADYTGQTPKSGSTYYLWNVGQQQFLSATDGVLTLGGSPIAITINAHEAGNSANYGEATDGYVTLTTGSDTLKASPFLRPRSDSRGKYSDWTLQATGTDNNYTLSCRYRVDGNTSAYLYYSPIFGYPRMTLVKPFSTMLNGQWRFVDPSEVEQIITLDEAATEYSVPTLTGTSATVHLKRTFTLSSWNSLCVPFAIPVDQLKSQFGDDVRLAEYTGVNASTLLFRSTTNGVVAGTPYLIRPTKAQADGTDYYEFTGVTTFASNPTSVAQTASTADGGATITYVGSFYKTTAPAKSYVLRKNLIYHLSKDMSMKGFRGYFQESGTAMAKEISAWTLDEATGITTVNADADTAGPTYNLQGQRVNGKAKLQRGVYIIGGKKVIK